MLPSIQTKIQTLSNSKTDTRSLTFHVRSTIRFKAECHFRYNQQVYVVTVLSGGHSDVVPPESIPNSVVKRVSADGSVGFPHVRVGHRQTFKLRKPRPDGRGFFMPAIRACHNTSPAVEPQATPECCSLTFHVRAEPAGSIALRCGIMPCGNTPPAVEPQATPQASLPGGEG